ncbi:MAG: inositol monophosphatase family protein [Pseudomonadota bacterium]
MALSNDFIAEITSVADACAEAAARETLAWFRSSGLDVDDKSAVNAFDPVTEGDRAAEAAIRAVLGKARPQDAILGEEEAATAGTSGYSWVIDPIDGTRAFVAGAPTWGTLIAFSEESGPLYGILDQPYIGERFCGGFGQATLRGPHGTRNLATRRTTSLDEAILFSTFPEIGRPAERAAFEAVARQVKLTRYGLDCYAYGLIAMGLSDLVIEAGLQPYDIQAPIALVEAAGGIVTNWEGGPAHGGGRAVAAATPELHAAALDALASAVSDG